MAIILDQETNTIIFTGPIGKIVLNPDPADATANPQAELLIVNNSQNSAVSLRDDVTLEGTEVKAVNGEGEAPISAANI